MAWYDGIGKAWDWMRDTAAPAVGGAFMNASSWVIPNAETYRQGMATLSSAANYPVSQVERGLATTDLALTSQFAGERSIADVDTWRDAWNLTTKHEVAPGQFAEGISLGQLGVGAFTNKISDLYDLKDTLPSAAAREHFFHDTWAGQLTSGSIDAAVTLFGDPLIIVGKGAKALELTRATIRPEDVAPAFRVIRGEAAPEEVGKRAANKAGQITDFISWTRDKSPAEIVQHPALRDSRAGGTIAYLMNQADTNAASLEEADTLKRNVFGALLGERASVDAIVTQRGSLASDLRALMDTPQPTWAVGHFTPGTGGGQMFMAANATTPPEVIEQAKTIRDELLRLDGVIEAKDTSRTVTGTLKAQFAADRGLSRIQTSTLHTGIGNRPITVIAGALSNRLEGHVSLRDPMAGFEQLSNTLNASRYIDPESKLQLLNDFLKASTDGARQGAVRSAEAEIVRSTAANYGIGKDQVALYMALGTQRRKAFGDMLKSRLYSAADSDPYISYTDPETGQIIAQKNPLLRSQLEDFHPILDPSAVDKVLKSGSNNRWLERAIQYHGLDVLAENHFLGGGWANREVAQDLLSKMYDKGDALGDMINSGLQIMTRIWKDSMLLTRPLAYAARVQIDSQARMISHMGPLQAMGALFKEGIPNLSRYYASVGNGLSPDERMLNTLKPMFAKNGFSEDEAKDILSGITSRGGGLADLASEMGSRGIEKFRSEGEWGYVSPNDPNWMISWFRAVDRQIRNSPVAMEFVRGRGIDEAKSFVLHDPDGLAEWQNLSSSHDNNLDQWLAKVQNHVEHYLPSGELKNYAARRIPGEMEALGPEKLYAAAELKGNLVDALGREIPRNDVTREVYNDLLTNARDLRAHHSDLRQQMKALDIRRRNGEDVKDEIRSLKGEIQTAYTQSRKQFQTASEARRVLSEGTAKVKATELQARTVHAAQTAIANPERPVFSAQKVKDYFLQGDGSNRMPVHGASYAPTNRNPLGRALEGWEKMREDSYRLVSDAPETILARMPLYMSEYKRLVKETTESALINRTGPLSRDEFDNIRKSADRQARKNIGDILFDASDTSNMAHYFRFVSPFFAAWEDMVKKWGNLFYENPATAERMRQLWNAPTAAGMETDEYGNRRTPEGEAINPVTGLASTVKGQRDLISIPIGFIPKGLRDTFGVGNSLKVDKNSFNIIFQGDPPWLPGFGPLVQIPANEIIKRSFTKDMDNPVVRYLLPFGVTNQSISEQFMPAWARHLKNATGDLFGTSPEWREQMDLQMKQEWVKYQQGKRDNPFLHSDEISNRVRNRFILRAVLGFGAPVSVTPDNEMQFYLDQAHRYQNEFGQIQNSPEYKTMLGQYQQYGKQAKARLLYDHPEYADWLSRFQNDYPDYFDLGVSISTNDSGLVATNKAISGYKKYQDVINAHPEYAWMIVGPEDNAYGLTADTQYSQNVHTYEVGQPAAPGSRNNLRNYDDPQTAIKNAEAARGWKAYSVARTVLNIELEKRGIGGLNSKGAEDLRLNWNNYMDYLSEWNPYWRDQYAASDEAQSVKTLEAARDLIATHPNVVKERTDMNAMNLYMQGRQSLMQELVNRGYTSLNSKANQDLANNWDSFLAGLREYSPGFEQIWNKSLANDQFTLPMSARR